MVGNNMMGFVLWKARSLGLERIKGQEGEAALSPEDQRDPNIWATTRVISVEKSVTSVPAQIKNARVQTLWLPWTTTIARRLLLLPSPRVL